MKTAKEYTCSMFSENIRAFIDNELPVNEKSFFLYHSSECKNCNLELLRMQHVKKELAGLKCITVSPEFDFKMKSCIRQEQERLRNPLYSFKLFMNENLGKFVTVPAFAVLILIAAVFYNKNDVSQNTPVLPDIVISRIDSGKGVELIPENEGSSVEEINYILEIVKSSDIEQNVNLADPGAIIPDIPINNELILVNF